VTASQGQTDPSHLDGGGHGGERVTAQVLLVEADPLQADVIRQALEAAGYRVLEARDEEEALTAASRERPALAIIEASLAGIDGYELCRSLREDEELVSMPILLLTGPFDPIDVTSAVRCGVDAQLTKPCDVPTLLERVASLLESRADVSPAASMLPMTVRLAGQVRPVSADPVHIVNLLVSTCQNAVMQNRQLQAARLALESVTSALDERLAEQARHFERVTRIQAMVRAVNSACLRSRDRGELLDAVTRISVDTGSFAMAWIGTLGAKGEASEILSSAGDGIADFLELAQPNLADHVKGVRVSAADPAEASMHLLINPGDESDDTSKWLHFERRISCVISVPLIHDEEVFALMLLYSTDARVCDAEVSAILADLAADLSFALQFVVSATGINSLAYYDGLTPLPNRALLLNQLAQHLARPTSLHSGAALMLVDIQRFSQVNDNLGRAGGDEVLRAVGSRLAKSVGAQATAAHIASDLFAFVVRNVAEKADAIERAKRVLKACFGTPFVIQGRELRLAGRVGLALYPADAGQAEDLYRRAEAALIRARKTGENYLAFAPEMIARVAGKLDLETRLRRAVEAEEFVLHYQPKICARSGRALSVEALIRWQDPAGGLVSPDQFIPLLEETGLILPVGYWALREAVRQRAQWTAMGFDAPRVAVNVSAFQLRSADFVRCLEEALRSGRTEDHAIDLELTESLVMSNVDDNAGKLAAARELGARIYVDDFGTGYSSLQYIARLPLDALKIDRSFVTSMSDTPANMTVVSSIITLGRNLNFELVAEGVETEDQAKLLRLLKCDTLQGYLFSRPLPADKIPAFFTASAP
jgi:diguanylate cyclase (GGDEF)-like protein